MLKNNSKNKCASIEYADSYTNLRDGLTNPYHYNFGRIMKNGIHENYAKVHHIVNSNSFYKR